MNLYTLLVMGYAKICNFLLWPVSRKLAKTSPSLELDYRKAAFPISFEEYISIAIFTTAFAAFELFFIFATVLMLFNSAPAIADNQTVQNQTAMVIAQADFVKLSSQSKFLSAGREVNFTISTDRYNTKCEMQMNGITYDFRLRLNLSANCLGNLTNSYYYSQCFLPAVQGKTNFTYVASFIPYSSGEYSYSVACSEPSLSGAGKFTVFSGVGVLSGTVSSFPAVLKSYFNGTLISEDTVSQSFSVVLPSENLTVVASSNGSTATADVTPSAIANFAFKKGSVLFVSSGTVNISSNDYSLEKRVAAGETISLGVGSWNYVFSSPGYADLVGSFNLAENETYSLDHAKGVATNLIVSISPEAPKTDEEMIIYVNYTDLNGNNLYTFTPVTVDGNNATLISIGIYSFYFNNSAEGAHTIMVLAEKDGFQSQEEKIQLTVKFNSARVESFQLGLRIAAVLLTIVVSAFLFMIYPSQRAETRGMKIDAALPFALSHMSSMAKSGITIAEIIRLMSKYSSSEEIRREFSKVMKAMEILGNDLITSIKMISINTPSKKFSQIIDSLATTIHSGGDLSEFLKEKSNETRLELSTKTREKTSTMMVLGEIYVIMFIASPIFLVVMLLAMEFIGSDALPLPPITILKLLAYFVLPLMTVGFVIFLSKEINPEI